MAGTAAAMQRAVVLLVFVAASCVARAAAHELPSFPRITVLAARPDPFRPLSWNYSVRVLDPAGRAAVTNADVRITGFERRRGSDVRLGAFWLAPTPSAGVYQGTVEFPEGGSWEVTITVKGRFVGEAHVQAVVGSPGPVRSPLDRPDLDVDWILARHLLLEWGHLAGFGLWLGATVVGLLVPQPNLRTVAAVTWIALVMSATTGLYKLQVGTPFPNGLTLGRWDVPRIFFGREYLTTLVVKHILTAGAIIVTAALTWRAWRHPESHKTARRLLAVNLALAVVIAGCVTVLNLLHAIVLHFS
jgi:hypothetical protein